ncbi:MAG: DUF4373 domain-containing protein [Muribaculaceae bacterium]|nr:DUF4373 domain-containing protein [Muribaculaceae bacterium]
MAGRPRKTGLDYFPFGIDFFNDEKIICIGAEFGMAGELTAVKLLCAIYSQGYFIRWTEAMRFKILRQLPGVEPETLDRIIQRLIKWEFFNKEMFENEQILTSEAIQRRYFEIMRRCMKQTDYEYLLLDSVEIGFKTPAAGKADGAQTEAVTGEQPRTPAAPQQAKSPQTPSPEQVEEYFRNHPDRPQQWQPQSQLFYSHYTAAGWRAGNGSPIMNWQSKADYWILKENQKTRAPAAAADRYERRRGVEPSAKSRTGFHGTFDI